MALSTSSSEAGPREHQRGAVQTAAVVIDWQCLDSAVGALQRLWVREKTWEWSVQITDKSLPLWRASQPGSSAHPERAAGMRNRAVYEFPKS